MVITGAENDVGVLVVDGLFLVEFHCNRSLVVGFGVPCSAGAVAHMLVVTMA